MAALIVNGKLMVAKIEVYPYFCDIVGEIASGSDFWVFFQLVTKVRKRNGFRQ